VSGGVGITRTVETIRDDERRVITVFSLTTGVEAFKGACLSLLSVVGLKGISTEIRPGLLDEEHLLLQGSSGTLEEAVVDLRMTRGTPGHA
jgi:malate/lactate dehydrogenase